MYIIHLFSAGMQAPQQQGLLSYFPYFFPLLFQVLLFNQYLWNEWLDFSEARKSRGAGTKLALLSA